MNTLEAIEVPWMISPSSSSMEACVTENGDCVVLLDAACLPNIDNASDEMLIRRVRVTFVRGQRVRFFPSYSDGEVLPPGLFRYPDDSDWMTEDYIDRMRAVWRQTSICPTPRFYRVIDSEWQKMADADRFGSTHYLLKGHDAWMEVLAHDWRWEWVSMDVQGIEGFMQN